MCHGKLHARKVLRFLHGCERNVWLPGCDGNVCVLLDVRCVKGVFFFEMWGGWDAIGVGGLQERCVALEMGYEKRV